MKRPLLPVAALLLAACGPDPDDAVDPVPQPSAEGTNALLAEAERAAENAQRRIGPATGDTNQQRETRQ